MRHDAWARQYLEAEDPLGDGLLNVLRHESILSGLLQGVAHSREHLYQVRAGPAAWVEHVDVLIRQSASYVELVFEPPVHALDHVAHDLPWGVPDPELLP